MLAALLIGLALLIVGLFRKKSSNSQLKLRVIAGVTCLIIVIFIFIVMR